MMRDILKVALHSSSHSAGISCSVPDIMASSNEPIFISSQERNLSEIDAHYSESVGSM
jgi:hypothetical protein